MTLIEFVEVPGISDKSELTIGVLADTHLPFRLKRLPTQLLTIFRDVDLILHAGDVDQMEYIRPLEAIAPLYAVRGNLHFKPNELSHGGIELPFDLHFSLLGHHIVLNHGGWPHFWALASDWLWEKLLEPSCQRSNARIARRLLRMYPEAGVIIFGHTHQPYRVWHGKTLLFNPGGVVPFDRFKPSVGRLILKPDEVLAELIPLDEEGLDAS
ncbi:MAG: metallophosphatase family protein [Anaerolineae bacterium]|nr:metallophosphatase family protein [Anaerolineae bacterium]MDW8072048.1 metallophosphoesterase family protein [Anaerolineae bacterium]